MTLRDIIKVIEKVAAEQPSVNLIVQNDIFRINEVTDAKYGAFAWEQTSHTGSVNSDWMHYGFRFVFADRLTEDRGNRLEVQSNAMDTLRNIMSKLSDLGIFAGAYSIQPFMQKFKDECSGAFCTLTIDAPVSGTCAEEYIYYEADGRDFNVDFNDDFAIYSWIVKDKKVRVI